MKKHQKLTDRLNEYKYIRENVNELEERLLEIDTQIQKITQNISDMPQGNNTDPDKLTNKIQAKIDIENQINDEITNGYKEMKLIEDLIEKLDEREKLLMRLRYINCYSWEKICVEMNYSWRQVHYIHSNSLKKIKVKFKKR